MARTSSFILGFTFGAFAGVAAALLLAPQSGEETVHRLQERGIELKGQLQTQAERLAEEARVRAQQASEEARVRAQHVGGTVKEQVDRGRVILSEKARKAHEEAENAAGTPGTGGGMPA